MFLTVGDKIRRIRQQFNLKQGVFKQFGITQHYLSMIETNKRQAPQETLKDIYEALLILTNGEVESLYTFEAFCMPIEVQAKYWLKEQLNSNHFSERYELLISIAENYCLAEGEVAINKKMAKYYFKINDYSTMAHYYRRAIACSMKHKLNPAHLHMEFGRYSLTIGHYDEAVLNLCLATTSAQLLTEKSFIIYDAQIFLAVTYHRMKEYELGLEVINHLLMQEEELIEGRYIGALVVKEMCVRGIKGPEESRKYLLKLLDSDQLKQYPQHLHYVYHTLGWNYIEAKKYDEALDVMQKALPLRENESDKALTTLLIGHINFEIGEYEIAQSYYDQTKERIFSSNSLRTKRLWIDEQLDLYCRLNQIEEIKQLFAELRQLVNEGKFPESMLYGLKATIYKRFEGQILVRREEYRFLHDFFAL